MPDQNTIAEWVTAAKVGSQQAIENLYTCAWKEVNILLRTMIHTDEDTIQDLVQDSFMKAFQRLDQLEDPRKYKAWVKQIARNTALDHLKKSRAILFSELQDDDSIPVEFEDEDLSHLPDVVIDQKDTLRLLYELIDSLSPVQRTMFTMHYLENIPIPDIAKMLGSNENTIKSNLRKARNNLQKKIRELEKKEDIKLYSLSPLAFLLLLLRNAEAMPAQPNMVVLGDILQANTASAPAAATTAAAGTGTKAAGEFVIKKVIAGILAAITLTGGAALCSSVLRQPEYPEKDLFANDFRVTFDGANGAGVVHVSCLNDYGLDYDVEPETALANGDVVTLTLSAPNGDELPDYCEEHYGFTPATDTWKYTVHSLPEATTESAEAQYDYEKLVADYTAIIKGEIPIDQAGIDLRQSALWVTPLGCTINENGFFNTRGTVRYSFVRTDLNEDGIDELISLEEYKVGDMEWKGAILDIFTLKDGEPNWLIAGAYRGPVDIFVDGIIRQWCDGGAHYYVVNFYMIQNGDLVLVNTAGEEDYVFSIRGEVYTKDVFLADVDQYAPRLATDMERLVIIEP